MSWFDSLKSTLSNSLQEVQTSLEEVKTAMPKSSDELLTALTLTTPELTAQRAALDQEERRKEALRDSLASLLPWETRQEEQEVLVEECYNAIMALSTTSETFKVDVAAEDNFPDLLKEFDLDAHVGLIQRLLQEDNNLKEMQSQFLCGGEKEKRFWRNYFYNCAKARTNLGLSLEEIWTSEDSVSNSKQGTIGAATDTVGENGDTNKNKGNGGAAAAAGAAGGKTKTGPLETAVAKTTLSSTMEPDSSSTMEDEAKSDSNSPGKDFEMVDDQEDLDDLAAEIAKELED